MPSHGYQNAFNLRQFLSILTGLILLALLAAWSFPSATDSLSDAEKRRKVMEMYADYRSEFPAIEEIKAADALQLLGNPGTVFVDVREPEEQAVSMLPGAIASETFLADPDRYRNKRIIAYCTISYRSGKLTAKLMKKGITITNLEGGLLAWVHAGGPLTRNGEPVETLHVYGRKWDLAPHPIETVY